MNPERVVDKGQKSDSVKITYGFLKRKVHPFKAIGIGVWLTGLSIGLQAIAVGSM